MKQQRVYIDTSVIGGCFDQEFAPWANGPVRDFQAGLYLPWRPPSASGAATGGRGSSG
jgi:hypothetical protein